MNPRSDNNEALVRWETIPLDVKAGVEFFKKQPGITKVILWGFSGGGPTMTSIKTSRKTACRYARDRKSWCNAATSSLACQKPMA